MRGRAWSPASSRPSTSDVAGTLDINVQAANGAAPGLDPGSIASAGLSAGSPHEAAGQAMATAGYASATKVADLLRGMDVSQQREYWGELDPQQQGMLSATGYKLPPSLAQMSHSPGGLLGFITGVGRDITSGVSAGFHDLAQLGSDALNWAASGLRATQHIVRAGQFLS